MASKYETCFKEKTGKGYVSNAPSSSKAYAWVYIIKITKESTLSMTEEAVLGEVILTF